MHVERNKDNVEDVWGGILGKEKRPRKRVMKKGEIHTNGKLMNSFSLAKTHLLILPFLPLLPIGVA